ncbi:MAG TPA: GGDEF domain-containing protein [Candidatus Acidoferrum sp.]|nr:GGDEF domain-containing protein [Candidatus Acidoferrum sp.]
MDKEQILTEVLFNSSIGTVFQPIVSLETGVVFGYEALSRISIPACEVNIEELFQIAHRQDRLWELEMLCRTKALQHAARQSNRSVLFLNVDGNIIHDPQFRAGFTVEKLREYGVGAGGVVIELTEKSAVADIEGFMSSVSHYKAQGFQIAIDDFGSGYSGLNRVCTLLPKFLKIDINLIRDINKDALKRSAVCSTVEFCRQVGIQVVAEGIETEEELKTVIQLGVNFGQGYYLLRPQPDFQGISPEREQQIRDLSKARLLFQPSAFGRVGELGAVGATAAKTSPSLPIFEKLKQSSKLTEFFVLDEDEQVCGILPRQHVFEKFGGQYGYTLSRRIEAGALMLSEVLAVDEQMPIEKVSELAMQRSADRVYDSIAVTRGGKYMNTVTVRELLLTSIQLQMQRATNTNPLTGLPGNQEIQLVINAVFRQEEPWAIVYLDIDNFKAYNDAYGFVNGDAMLKTLAEVMRRCAGATEFLGHIGGDDFVMVTRTGEVLTLCQKIVKEFHQAIESLYSPTDWEQGYIVSKDRNGFTRNFAIASLSVAVVTNREQHPQTMDELSLLIAHTKKKCKQAEGDAIIII